MEQKQFDLALQFCGNNASQRSQVLLQQAHHLLSKHQCVANSCFVKCLSRQADSLMDFLMRSYEKAAKLYAQTEASFEEVALKFMEIKQEDALQAFLLEVSTFSTSSAESLA